MCPAAEVLVIILSILLAIFLVLGIILTIYLIILTKQIRRVAQSAEKTVDDIESVVSGFSKVLSPIFIAEVFSRFLKRINVYKKKEK